MSLRAIPLILFVFIFYNILVLIGGGSGTALETDKLLRDVLVAIPLGKETWNFSWGDLIVLLLFFTLFAELLKATYTSSTSLLDHGLSMLVFVVCLIEFQVSLPKGIAINTSRSSLSVSKAVPLPPPSKTRTL